MELLIILAGIFAVFIGCKAIIEGKAVVYEKESLFRFEFTRKTLTGNMARAVGILWLTAGSLFILVGLRTLKII